MTDAVISGPESVTLSCNSWRGPFAANRCMALAPTQFSIVNGGAGDVALGRLSVEPLRDSSTGLTASGRLELSAPAGTVPAEASMLMTIGGDVPAQPGQYATVARLADGALAIPLSIKVSAAPAWGILCMLLGLLTLGVLNLLSGTGTVKSVRHDALQSWQDIHATLEATPAPASRATEIMLMNQHFEQAIAILDRGRQASLLDHRLTEAQPLISAAEKTASTLREQLAGQPVGAAEIDDLDKNWKDFQPAVQILAKASDATPAGTGFAHSLDVFLAAYRETLVRGQAVALLVAFSTRREHMSLLLASGEGESARMLALNTRSWLGQSAKRLDAALTLFQNAVSQAGNILNNDHVLRERALHDDLPDETRKDITDRLDAAEAALSANPTLAGFRDTNKMIDETLTAQMRAAVARMKRQVDASISDATRQTDFPDVAALLDKLNAAPKPHTPAMKKAGLTQILELWRGHVAQVTDPPTKMALTQQIDAMQALVDAEKFKDTSALYLNFTHLWTAWENKVLARAVSGASLPHCQEYASDLTRSVALAEAQLQELAAQAQFPLWRRRLDAINGALRTQISAEQGGQTDCLSPLVAIGSDINGLSSELSAAAFSTPPLRLAVTTPLAERVAGRPIAITLGGGEAPAGNAASFSLSFGDGTAPQPVSADAVAKTLRISHVYARPLAAHVVVRAEGPRSAALGETDILVLPSDVSASQAVADEFVSMRFMLALIIAAIGYFWRYHARTAAFGARSFDYAEAFALGFAVDAAVSDLPRALAGLVG